MNAVWGFPSVLPGVALVSAYKRRQLVDAIPFLPDNPSSIPKLNVQLNGLNFTFVAPVFALALLAAEQEGSKFKINPKHRWIVLSDSDGMTLSPLQISLESSVSSGEDLSLLLEELIPQVVEWIKRIEDEHVKEGRHPMLTEHCTIIPTPEDRDNRDLKTIRSYTPPTQGNTVRSAVVDALDEEDEHEVDS